MLALANSSANGSSPLLTSGDFIVFIPYPTGDLSMDLTEGLPSSRSRGILHHGHGVRPYWLILSILSVNWNNLGGYELRVLTPVASLGLVTPGAATVGVTPLFFLENLATFFAHRCHYHYRFLLLSLGCHPLQGVTHTFFTCPTSFLHYSS